jgi:integrase/recombinase XerD
MLKKRVHLIMRVVQDGKRISLTPAQAKAKGLSGPYYLRWFDKGKLVWQAVGKDHSTARVALIRKEYEFRGASSPTQTKGLVTLADAISAFLAERTASQDVSTVVRWQWELARFAKVTGKTYLRDVNREDVFKYWNSFKEAGAADRTIYNRVQSLLTFLTNRGITGLIKKNEMPRFDEKDVDYYTEQNPAELEQFFAACNSEERLAYKFFLYSGCREREVMFATWQDIDFVERTYTVQPKKDLGFRVKNGKVRCVPLPIEVIEALKTYLVMTGSRRLIFTNAKGTGPEGHFLYRCKQIAHKAGLNCGHCINKQGKSCKDYAVCAKWSLHKFRRTFATINLLNGVPITQIQYFIGHSDLTTLNRYLARISAKSDLAKQMSENMVKWVGKSGAAAADMMAERVKV